MSLCVNHGGVAVVAATGIRASAVDLGVQPMAFECAAARITSYTSHCLAVVVYRPGLADVTASFFTELADVLDRVSTFADPLVLAGDLNLRLERQHDPYTIEFNNLLAGYGLHQQVVGLTHDAGIALDVCTRSDFPAPTVEILDVSLSDHRLLCWISHFHRLLPVYTSTSRRSWRSFDMDVFLADLQSSPLFDERQWQGLDVDALAELYNKTISQLLDDQAPVQHVTCRRRPM